MLQLNKKEQAILQKVLGKYPFQFYAYGSRVKGTARIYSDLDICYQEPIPSADLLAIKEELTESNLPFIVEVVN
jgi:uncharacterized protein